MFGILAQAPDWGTLVGQSGLVVAFVTFLMYQSTKATERDDKRNAERDARMDRVCEELANHTAAVNALTQGLLLEVLTRPQVVERARKEAEALLQAVGGGK